jgi:antitoxin (DNA-binding transcriptional repressor) of toxin-antitoxin stability system
MGQTVTQRELRNDSPAVLGEVQAGQALIIRRNGVPVAELRFVPPRGSAPRAVIADAARRAPRVDARRLRVELNAVADPTVDG